MTLEEHIKRYDDRSKSIRDAIVEKEESQEVVELLRELKAYRDGCKCDDCIHSEKAHDEYPCYMCVGSELWKFKGGKG